MLASVPSSTGPLQARFAVNARFVHQPQTGVQRFAAEVLRCLLTHADYQAYTHGFAQPFSSALPLRTIGQGKGYWWEQVSLPRGLRTRGKPLLLSPANLGPLHYAHQVVMVHDAAVFRHPAWFRPSVAAFYRFLLPRLARRVEGFFTVSEFSKSELLHFLPIGPERVWVVPGGLSELVPGPDTPPPFRYVLAVASPHPRKNLLGLVQAMHLLRHTDLHLVVVGTHSAVVPWHSLGEAQPRLHWLGRVSDGYLATLYAHAAVFAMPSLYEGFGLPVLEALSLGCPVAVSDIEPFRSLFGAWAYFFEPQSPQSIAEVLHLAAVGTRPQVAGLLRERFSWQQSAAAIDARLRLLV